MKNIQHIAVMWDTKEIVAAGVHFTDVCRDADKANIYEATPGNCAPFFYTSIESKDFFRAWFPEGFWAKWKERNGEEERS